MIAFVLTATLSAVAIAVNPFSGFSDDAELHTDLHDEPAAKFAAFIQEQGRAYASHSEEYRMRFAHFQEHLAAVEAQNAQTDRLWSAAVNHLADRTPSELAMLRGYRHSPKGPGTAGPLGLASTSVRKVDVKTLPKNFTWKGHLAAMADVKDQSACGSCWAIASAVALRAHSELYQKDRTFSTQQILECTENPMECGGQGGCKGATAELAMEYAVTAGLATEEEHKYLGKDKTCAKRMQAPKHNLLEAEQNGVSLPEMAMQMHGKGGASFGMTGWERLPENKLEPLLLAVYEKGPVVVSVAAGGPWNMYSSGIMNACEKDAVISHAVVLVGFGQDNEQRFWQIQNSWGPSWGEDGFVRMFRHTNQEESEYCGYDRKPLDGTGCKGGPDKQYVCGSCAILYDNVVPSFALSDDGFLKKNTRDSTGVFAQLTASALTHLRH